MNDVLLNKRKIKRFLPADRRATDRDRAYTHEEIQRILLNCDERTRIIVLLLASTGMRIGAVSDIRLADLTEIPEYNLYRRKLLASPDTKAFSHYKITDKGLQYLQLFSEIEDYLEPVVNT
jgi:integrase